MFSTQLQTVVKHIFVFLSPPTMNHASWYSLFCGVPSHINFAIGHMTGFGQWDTPKHEAGINKYLHIGACTLIHTLSEPSCHAGRSSSHMERPHGGELRL